MYRRATSLSVKTKIASSAYRTNSPFPAYSCWNHWSRIDQHLATGSRAPATLADPFVEQLEIALELLLVLLFRNTVDPRRSRPVEFLECPPEVVDGEVMHESMHFVRRPFPSGRMYPVQSGVPLEWSGFADLGGQSELGHIPCSPSLHGRYPTSSLLREHLTSVPGIVLNSDMTPCSLTLDLGRCLALPDTDLSRSAVDLVYMPWSRTPVVPMGRRCDVWRCTPTIADRHWSRGPIDTAFASSYWLGHHETVCLSGLDPFTP